MKARKQQTAEFAPSHQDYSLWNNTWSRSRIDKLMQPHSHLGPSVAVPEMLFGQALRKLRTDRAISQETLAFESGYHSTYISQLERGKKNPSLRAIICLARALHISGSDIIKAVEDRLGRDAIEH